MQCLFKNVGIEEIFYEKERGLRRKNQILMQPGMFSYIENTVYKSFHVLSDGRMVHGFDLMFRTKLGYLGVAFFDIESSEDGWNVHLWISPYTSKIFRIRYGYHFEGVDGMFDHFGIRI